MKPYDYEPKCNSRIFNHQHSWWQRGYGDDFRNAGKGKIVVFGIPKSGNTWLVSLLCDYFGATAIDPIAKPAEHGIGMSHLPFNEMLTGRTDIKNAVCIIRHPIIVFASYFRYSQTEAFREAVPSFHIDNIEDFYYEYFLSRIVHAHEFNSYYANYAKLGVQIVKYENLLKDTPKYFERILKTWGYEVDSHKLSEAVGVNEFSKLKKDGKNLWRGVPASHFAKGEHNPENENLPNHILEDLEMRLGQSIQRWGYPFLTEVGENARKMGRFVDSDESSKFPI